MTVKRRPGRVIAFTDETIASLPKEGEHHADIWYDSTTPYLAYRPANPEDTLPRFVWIAGRKEVRGAAIAGKVISRIVPMLATNLSAARAELESLMPTIKHWREIGSLRGYRRTPKSVEEMFDQKLVDNPNYDALLAILMDAYNQAVHGKGADRHGAGLNFEDQDMLNIMDQHGSTDSATGQAMKKILEARRMKSKNKAREELLGAIVYIAGAILWKDRT